tara:strand:- start:792 stop:962 length:171 start_codon:yes stop_codon:yes gene_type:complete
MEDSLKTIGIGAGGTVVTWMQWLPDVVRVLVGLMTILYMGIKIYKELRNDSEKITS